MVRDERAEALEKAGLYRRAARRWLEVFDMRKSESERDWLRRRRNDCLRHRVTRAVRPESFRDVYLAATAVEKSMGLVRGITEAHRKPKQ